MSHRPATRRATPAALGIALVAGEDQAEALAAEVLDPGRDEPIVCLSTRAGEDRPALDPARVREALGRGVALRAVRTGPATRALSAALPPHLGVFGGAARIWWPGVDERCDPRAHPLILDRAARYGPRAVEAVGRRFGEGPPRAVARLVALPGGGERDASPAKREGRSRPPAAHGGGDGSSGAERGLLEARAEIQRLREKLAEARVDALAPRRAGRDQLAGLNLPAAVTRERERAHHLQIVAAWLVRDTDAGRRRRPLGPLALGAGYLASLDAHQAQVAASVVVTIAARIASGKYGEADDLDVRAESGADGSQELRAEDGAAAWSCALDPAAPQAARLRWWTRHDGAVELRDVTVA